MDDLFGSSSNWKTPNSSQTDPFGFSELNTNASAQNNGNIEDPFDFSVSNNILDDIFQSKSKPKQDIEYPAFFKSKTKPIDSINIDISDITQEPDNKNKNISNDIIWDFIDNPNPNNDTTKLFNNINKPNSKKTKWETATSNIRNKGMLTREIKQISKISPAAKWIISAYFKHECQAEDDLIIPECVEILSLMYLGHPAFIHSYLGDKNAEPLISSHKLFIIYGYHTLNIIIEEYMKSKHVINAVKSDKNEKNKNDVVLNEFFDEKERRIWRRDIKMPIPTYNGSYREMFEHIDELFFIEKETEETVEYNDWDEFIEIDSSKKEKEKKVVKDDWKLVIDSIDILFGKDGISEIEILIEQKDILSDWIRDYSKTPDPVDIKLQALPTWCQWKRKPKDITNIKILNLRVWK